MTHAATSTARRIVGHLAGEAASEARRPVPAAPWSGLCRRLAGAAPALVGPALLAALAAGCASPMQVQETRDLAKAYENRVYDLERQLAECERERTRLGGQLRDERMGNLSDATYGGEIQERMRSLEAMLDGLGRPLQDIERFDVEGGYILMIQDKVLFESGSDELNTDGKAALASLAGEIQQRPHGEVFVRGHTDSDPVKKEETKRRFPKGNLQLSAARAIAVGSYLIEAASVPPKDVVVMGFGQWNPLKPNDSADNKRLNRRVEIFVSDPAQQ
jgi:chemotaxis protein MotB